MRHRCGSSPWRRLLKWWNDKLIISAIDTIIVRLHYCRLPPQDLLSISCAGGGAGCCGLGSDAYVGQTASNGAPGRAGQFLNYDFHYRLIYCGIVLWKLMKVSKANGTALWIRWPGNKSRLSVSVSEREELWYFYK